MILLDLIIQSLKQLQNINQNKMNLDLLIVKYLILFLHVLIPAINFQNIQLLSQEDQFLIQESSQKEDQFLIQESSQKENSETPQKEDSETPPKLQRSIKESSESFLNIPPKLQRNESDHYSSHRQSNEEDSEMNITTTKNLKSKENFPLIDSSDFDEGNGDMDDEGTMEFNHEEDDLNHNSFDESSDSRY